MKQAGCWLIAFGIESGSQTVLDNVKKDARSRTRSGRSTCARSTESRPGATSSSACPARSKQTVRETIDLAKRIPLDIALFHVAMPYAGTEFYFQAVANGWLNTYDWKHFDMNDSAVVGYGDFGAEEILKATKQAFREFYLRPVQAWRLLRMMQASGDFGMVALGRAQLPELDLLGQGGPGGSAVARRRPASQRFGESRGRSQGTALASRCSRPRGSTRTPPSRATPPSRRRPEDMPSAAGRPSPGPPIRSERLTLRKRHERLLAPRPASSRCHPWISWGRCKRESLRRRRLVLGPLAGSGWQGAGGSSCLSCSWASFYRSGPSC